MPPALPPNAPQSNWRVTGQTEVMQPGPGGTVVDGYKVSFTTQGGVEASVFIPRSLYTPDNVRASIAAAAHQLDLVQGMTG